MFHHASWFEKVHFQFMMIPSETTKIKISECATLLQFIWKPLNQKAISYSKKPNVLGEKKCRPYCLVFCSDILEAGLLVFLTLSECFGLQYSSSH